MRAGDPLVADNLVLTEIASSAQNGPLVADAGFADVTYLASTQQWDKLTAYMNGQLLMAEQNLPEGTRVEVTIRGWKLFGTISAVTVAEHVQLAWERGDLIDADTRRPVQAWPEYPSQIAWGDYATDSVTIRTVKNAVPVVVVWILVALLAAAAVWIIWQLLRSSEWSARSATSGSGSSPGGSGSGGSSSWPPTPGDVLGWAWRNWPWVLLGAGALAAAPFVVRQGAKLLEAGNEFAAAEHGEY